MRREIVDEFILLNGIKLKSTTLSHQFHELFEILSSAPEKANEILNKYFSEKNKDLYEILDIEKLVLELYKVDTFKWGADNQNDLGKYLVKKYIKDNISYDYLLSELEAGIMKTVQDYLICSWYNHWSSILIEHVFKSHKNVLPTVGQIKSVDFFINELPFDLKVTYLPVNFIEAERKKHDLRPEITALKIAARQCDIKFNNGDSNLYYLLSEMLKDNGSAIAKKTINEIKDFRIKLIEEVKKDSRFLAKNLYEEQSSFRFGAENRIFVVLIDKEHFEESWKLKRNLNLLKPAIHNYLDTFNNKSLESLKVKFYKEGNPQRLSKGI